MHLLEIKIDIYKTGESLQPALQQDNQAFFKSILKMQIFCLHFYCVKKEQPQKKKRNEQKNKRLKG